MVWMPIVRDLAWCHHGLMEFYKDYPQSGPSEPVNGLTNGIIQMQEALNSRDHRRDRALADIMEQRIIYDEEQRLIKCAMALILSPHEYFQSATYTHKEYIQACITKVLMEQSVYNHSPFLLTTGSPEGHVSTSLTITQTYNEIMVQFHHHGSADILLTDMIAECHNYIERRFFEGPAIEPAVSGMNAPPTANTMHNDHGFDSAPNKEEVPQDEEEPSSVERAMVNDQEELCNGELLRRLQREDRLARNGIVPDPIACDVLGRPLVCTHSASDTALDAAALAELAAWHENMFSQYQHVPWVTIPESRPSNLCTEV